jgi:hypothetical protein
MVIPKFEDLLDVEARKIFASLTSPARIQAFLDEIPYRSEEVYLSPLSAIRDGKAHCFDGGLLGALALRRLGYPPVIIDLIPWNDDDHVLAVYKIGRRYGAVAKSNYSGLRLREAVYRDPRELVMSYFEQYFNTLGQKTLRGYTHPIRLLPYDRWNWETEDAGAGRVYQRMLAAPKVNILSEEQIEVLALADERSVQAGLLGSRAEGLYKPHEVSTTNGIVKRT